MHVAPEILARRAEMKKELEGLVAPLGIDFSVSVGPTSARGLPEYMIVYVDWEQIAAVQRLFNHQRVPVLVYGWEVYEYKKLALIPMDAKRPRTEPRIFNLTPAAVRVLCGGIICELSSNGSLGLKSERYEEASAFGDFPVLKVRLAVWDADAWLAIAKDQGIQHGDGVILTEEVAREAANTPVVELQMSGIAVFYVHNNMLAHVF